jgi:hypothetical protein
MAFEALFLIQIESSALAVEILPEVGGKVGQIRDKLCGQSFLVPPQRPYRTIPMNGDWLVHDTSGMDDCFPNVAAGAYPEQPWMGTSLPDLGEWTHGVWEIANTGHREIVMERIGQALPYFASKAVRFVDDRVLEFSYRVENRGHFPIRYLWSAHPLISVQDGYELVLPPGNLTFSTFPSNGRTYSWPAFEGKCLSREWIPHGTNLKIFVAGLTEGWCELRLPTHTLRFVFDRNTVPVVGIWLNNFGFPSADKGAFRCIAVEPCTSPSDLLDDLDPMAYPRIAAGETATWSLQLSILPRESADAQKDD